MVIFRMGENQWQAPNAYSDSGRFASPQPFRDIDGVIRDDLTDTAGSQPGR